MSTATDFNMQKAGAETKLVELVPQKSAWATMTAGGIVPLGMACAATAATYSSASERVAVMAWIAVAIVGTASVIAAAAASRRRTKEVGRRSPSRDHGAHPQP